VKPEVFFNNQAGSNIDGNVIFHPWLMNTEDGFCFLLTKSKQPKKTRCGHSPGFIIILLLEGNFLMFRLAVNPACEMDEIVFNTFKFTNVAGLMLITAIFRFIFKHSAPISRVGNKAPDQWGVFFLYT
jgi:hypothetical protein